MKFIACQTRSDVHARDAVARREAPRVRALRLAAQLLDGAANLLRVRCLRRELEVGLKLVGRALEVALLPEYAAEVLVRRAHLVAAELGRLLKLRLGLADLLQSDERDAEVEVARRGLVELLEGALELLLGLGEVLLLCQRRAVVELHDGVVG